MYETDRLKRALERAAQGAQDAAVAGPQDCLARILDQMDMMVLPRDVRFDNGVGQTLSLTLKSRRLIRINAPAPNVAGAEASVVETALSAQTAQIATLAHLIAGFASEAVALKITVSEPAQPQVLTEMGVSVAQLREALTGAGYALPSREIDTIAKLTNLAEAHGLTWARFAGGDMESKEGEARVLDNVHAAVLPHILKTERPPKGRAGTWLLGAAGLEEGHRLAITAQDEQVIIAVVPHALTQDWIAACAGRETA